MAANLVDSAEVAPWPALPARYQAQARLASGAQADTFTVVDRHDSAERVLKLFHAAGSASALAEFRNLETLVHPSIVRVRDLGRTTDGRLFLVTDKIAGSSLDRLTAIADEDARRRALGRVAVDLATALALLHARGIVHGDVTPANVRLSDAGRGEPLGAVLLDFGLAGSAIPGGGGGARGTLGYAAPEALTGARTPATDLFGLGATLYEAWCGAPPFGRGLAAAQRTLSGPAPALSAVRPGLGAAWDRLLDRLLAADPAERPFSARVLLRELASLTAEGTAAVSSDLEVPYPDGDPLAGLFVGRRAERASLRRAFESLAEGPPPSGVVALVGPPGSGGRTLFDVVARDVTVAAVAQAGATIEIWRGDFGALERWLDPAAAPADEDPRRALEHRQARLAQALEARSAQRPLAVYLEDGPTAQAFARFVAGAAPVARALLVVAARAPIDAPFASAVELPPLGVEEVAALASAGLDRPPPEQAVAAIAAASAGNAAVAAALARRLIASLRAGTAFVASSRSGEDLDGLLAEGFSALSPPVQQLLLAGALIDRDVPRVAGLEEEAAAAARVEADRAGWLRATGDGAFVLPSPAHRRVVLAAARRVAGAAQVAERALAAGPPSAEQTADALWAAGRSADAAEALRAAARAATADPGRAAELLGRALSLAPIALSFRERVVQATGLGALGRYDEASRVLAAARALAGSPGEIAEAHEREAWLLARRGDLAAARATLERGLAAVSPDLPAGRMLRARLGRLLVTAGQHREALATVATLLSEAGEAPVRLLAGETALLANGYLGQRAAAAEQLAALQAQLSETRRAYLTGLLAQLAGDAPAARDAYRVAYERAAAAEDIHTVASVALNLGGLLLDEGLYGEALATSARAVRELGRLGATAELLPALVNAANLLVSVGDLAAARRSLDRAAALARRSGAPAARATAAFVDGDLARRAGELETALVRYAESRDAFAAAGLSDAAAAAAAARVEVLVARGQSAEAARGLQEARALRAAAAGDANLDPQLARAEAILALAGPAAAVTRELAERVARLARDAIDQGRRPLGWRLAALASALSGRAGLPNADLLELARRTFEQVRMATPEHHRATLLDDPDTTWLAPGSAAGAGEAALAARAQAAEARLRRLLRINKRLNSELRLPR
ncbi:MAG TPA: protein kinase, partial [Polyangia bacterium]|nr:protein kinase [Polyangia bacterium]